MGLHVSDIRLASVEGGSLCRFVRRASQPESVELGLSFVCCGTVWGPTCIWRGDGGSVASRASWLGCGDTRVLACNQHHLSPGVSSLISAGYTKGPVL